MHKRRFNEFTLNFTIRPQGPLLIKSGQESGADPTLLDMNFVRTYHGALGEDTVYLPGSSLKGTLRSYAEKIARTLGEGHVTHPPLSCNPLGRSSKPGSADYFCGQYLNDDKYDQADKHKFACPICRTFGHTSLASHLRISDAYPLDPAAPSDRTLFEQANATEQRDGVAIDRVSGAVAVGPFNLEVVTQGAFHGTLTLHNFQFWQLGLLAVVLRDIGRGQVPIGFGKSRGLGRVAIDYVAAEVAYPARFDITSGGYDFAESLYSVSSFLESSDAELARYGYTAEEAMPLPGTSSIRDDGSFGRVARAWQGSESITELWRASVPYWSRFTETWEGVEAGDG